YGSYKAEKTDELRARVRAHIEPEKSAPEKPITEKTTTKPQEPSAAEKLPTWMNLVWGGAGVIGLVSAAGLLISSATVTATALGVSPALVGVLAVAIGTSLPELAVNFKSA